jgi:DNA-binding SARP family transcriptional activator
LLEKGATSREVLLKEFWPEKRVQAAIRALHNLKARLHEILGVEAIAYHNGLYQINPAYEIVYDVWRYQNLIEEAYNAPQGLDLTHFAQAHDAYTGEFLEGRRKDWIIDSREKLQSLLAEADFRLAKILADYGEKDKAAAWFSFAFQLDSTRDDIMKTLMRFFIDLELPCQAMHFFYRYEENLHEKHGIRPGKQILALSDEAHAACYSSSSV